MARTKKKQRIIENIRITDFADEGKSLCREGDLVIFVTGAVPGDLVDLRIKRKKKSFAEAEVIAIREHSPMRTEAFCAHFGSCGGCKWQFLRYEEQLKFKQKQVNDALDRIAKVPYPKIQPILASEKTRFYRNKLEYTFSNSRWLTTEEIRSGQELDRRALGFHMPGSFDKILDIENCHLQVEPSNSIRLAVRDFAKEHNIPFFNIRDRYGELRNLIIRTSTTGDLMVIVQFYEKNEANIDLLMDFLADKFPQISSLLYIINQKGNDTFLDQEVICRKGEACITEEMEGLKFRIGPKSFYQTNSEQAYGLYKIVREFAGLKGDELVFDLYTGTGTIANFVAGNAGKVVGIEYVESAIEDARLNSEINGIKNTVFYAGDVKDVLSEAQAAHGTPDVLITDPPRAGMHEKVVRKLLEIRPKRIVYVSCKPATQARDAALLAEKYEIAAVRPVDMFPHTSHVENVICFERK